MEPPPGTFKMAPSVMVWQIEQDAQLVAFGNVQLPVAVAVFDDEANDSVRVEEFDRSFRIVEEFRLCPGRVCLQFLRDGLLCGGVERVNVHAQTQLQCLERGYLRRDDPLRHTGRIRPEAFVAESLEAEYVATGEGITILARDNSSLIHKARRISREHSERDFGG